MLLLLVKIKKRLRNEAQKYALSIVPVARGEAQRQLQDAEAYKQKVMAVAEGEADRFYSSFSGV